MPAALVEGAVELEHRAVARHRDRELRRLARCDLLVDRQLVGRERVGVLALVLHLEGDLLARLRLDEGGIEVVVVELHLELGARLRAHVLRALDGDLLAQLHRGLGRGRRPGPAVNTNTSAATAATSGIVLRRLSSESSFVSTVYGPDEPRGLRRRRGDTVASAIFRSPRPVDHHVVSFGRRAGGGTRRRRFGCGVGVRPALPTSRLRSGPHDRPRRPRRRGRRAGGVPPRLASRGGLRPTTRAASSAGSSRSPATSRSTRSACGGRWPSTRRC